MNELFECVLSLSLSGTSLILLLFLCKPLLRNVPNKRWQYYLWLIVIARLLIPFAPKISFVSVSIPETGLTAVQVTTDVVGNTPFIAPVGETGGELGGEFIGYQPAPVEVENNGHSLWIHKVLEVFTIMLWVVWLTGAAVLFIRKIIDYQRFTKGVKNDARQVSDPGLLDLLAECGELVGVMRPVELSVNRAVSSSMLIGSFHPCIILPTVDLTESDFRYTFLHELTHERRRDILYKWLVQFTLCLHWFNPFVWLMSREIDRACELACDEAVISKLESRERIEYGDMLMNAVRIGGSGRNLSGFIALYENKKMIRERLGAIMNFHKKTKWITFGSLSLALCLLVVSAIAGAYLVPAFTGSVEAAGTGAATEDYQSELNEEDAVSPVYQGDDTKASEYLSINDLPFNDQFKDMVRDGVYFIPYDGEDEFGDNLTAEVTDGSIMFAVLWIDGNYTKHITIYNECSMLTEEDISHISNVVVRNVLEPRVGIYSFDNVEVWLERDQVDEDGKIVVDLSVGAIRTLIRDPEESPMVQGMKAAMEEFTDPEEKEAARQVLETYLEDVGQYYNVPSENSTGYLYRAYISRPDGSDTAAAEYEFYHVSVPDFYNPLLAKMEEHETFAEVFTEEVGREHMRDEVQRIMAAREGDLN